MTILHLDDHTAEIFRHLDSQRQRFETELLDAGVPLPLPHRLAWATANPSASFWFIGARDADGKACCGFAIEIGLSRALPGHRIFRVERFGPALTEKAREIGLRGLAQLAQTQRRILRVNLEVLSRETIVRNAIAHTAVELGFKQPKNQKSYTDTIVIDLRPSESDIFASLHATARRHIRAIGKNPVALRAITEQGYADRMKHLVGETMARTDGPPLGDDWATIIKLSKQHPHLSRLSGIYSEKLSGADALLAFAWGRNHGDHVDYAVAASTRLTDLKLPLGYAPAWDLMCWAKRNGAAWFDFGGITAGTRRDDDPLGGISAFKRYFSGQAVTVAAEWMLEPAPVRATLANLISSGATWVSNTLRDR
jgi:hypothetical protein